MSTKIFVNLAVKDLTKSLHFYTELGYSVNPKFTDDNGGCVVISEEIYVMLLTEPFFATFTGKTIIDAARGIEVINALSADTRDEVDQLVDKALAAGGTVAKPPIEMDFMYSRSFHDLDGHAWEAVYMDATQVR
ncbi:VOC family protein [Amycolatopsis sp. GM8]|uniref:VOC family protein n=1 Tax=Amycolatopsis sp. GM8 TaxID=2896530 RepID=UPI001F38F050|nr:VOC family protein [Amycolatopsis sp. GM8]